MCVDKCDDGQYALARYGYTECVNGCPELIEGNKCVSSCTDKANMFIDGLECVTTCRSHKYIIEGTTKKCVDDCADVMSLDSSSKYYVCKDACTDDEVTSLEDPKICIAQD